MKKFKTLIRRALHLRAQSNSRSSSRQGSNPQNDASSGLDGTNRVTNSSIPQNVASSVLDGTNRDAKDMAPPWNGWEPDANFLTELHKWNIAHKDKKLPTVLSKIYSNLVESKPLQVALEFIPSSPFPAESLVKAIVSLFLLGCKIPQAKQDIYDFSIQMVVGIADLAAVIGETGRGQMSQKAGKDLQETRDLVNEISKWAYDRVKLSNNLRAEQEIKEVKEKLIDTRSKLKQIGIFRALASLDTLDLDNNKIEDLRRHGQIFRRLQFIEETLGHRFVPQAKYYSKEQKQREFHEMTRKRVLNEIEEWVRTNSDTENCWWITGRPAVGKSTIGAKVAKVFEDEKSLYAQYFITRNVAVTTDLDNILPTMAQQIAEKSPLAALAIQEKLETSPFNNYKKFSERQAEALFLEPLRAIAQYAPKVVVVIDGVDELANAEPSVLSRVTSVLCGVISDLPANVKVLIFSRADHWIIAKIPLHIKRLDLAIKDSEDDVERLVRAKLRDLAEVYMWNDWPTEAEVSLLCQLAAGHLGLAATALRWIASEIQHRGRARRDEVIKEVSRLGMGEIDDLYAFILDSILPLQDPARKRYLEGLKTVLGCWMVLQEPLDIGSISTLLSLDDFDVPHCMKLISSLIVDGTESVTERTVPQVHKSVLNYLVSSRSHPDLRINPIEYHHALTTICFESIRRLTFNVGHIKSSHRLDEKISISQGITYPCRWFGTHLEGGGQRATLEPDVERFMKTDFLLWLEVLSLQGLVDSVAVSTLKILEKRINGKNSALSLFIGDAIKFVKKFKEPIASNPAHIYISALPLAPSHSVVSQHYLPQYPRTLSVEGGPQTWDEFENKPVCVNTACISLDGTIIAAVFVDGTLCIYETTTGEAILPPFKVDEIPRSVIFSRDGKLVATGGHGLRLWNVVTGEEVESFDIDVYSLALSPDGTCIAAGCAGRYIDGDVRDDNYNIRVINLEEMSYSHAHILPSGGEGIKRLNVNSVAYSPDGTQIASSSDDSIVRVWDLSTGSERTFSANSSSIRCVAFSPDGTQIAVDTGLFNLSTGSFTPHAFRDKVNSIAFSPDGRFLTLGFGAACQIWDASTHQTLLFIGHTDDVRSLAFFPDGKHIMSASMDGTIRVWDVESLEERGEMDEWRMERKDDGCWVLGPEKEQLFWTSLPFRHARNTLVIGKCSKIDFSNFVHGDEWVKCREPL